MGGGDHFLAAATILDRFYDSPAVGLVKTSMQGYSSTTYIATFSDGNSVVLQFRPRDRALDEEYHNTARRYIGDLAPSARLLTENEDSLLVYELSRIPGFSFCELSKVPDYVHLLPTVADNVGTLLGRCCVQNSSCGTDKSWVSDVVDCLKKAAETSDPLLLSYKSDFATILAGVESGALDDLPLSIANGDLSPTNLMVTEKGIVSGLVDWEMVYSWPLGCELGAVHWIKGSGFGEEYSLYENADEIENRFWTAFIESIPRHVVQNLPSLQLAMKVGTVLYAVVNGKSSFPVHIPRLRAELDYIIPRSEACSSGRLEL